MLKYNYKSDDLPAGSYLFTFGFAKLCSIIMLLLKRHWAEFIEEKFLAIVGLKVPALR